MSSGTSKKLSRLVLEEGSLSELRAYKQGWQKWINFYQKEYLELSSQREAIKDSLLESLQRKCITDYSFKGWQRTVKFRYSLHPLSCVGSMSFVGQRFNYGKDTNKNLTPFPALYLAEDKNTSFQEVLGGEGNGELNSLELALTSEESISMVTVSGNLERVFDLRDSSSLGNFFSLIKNFKFSPELKKEARVLKLDAPVVITKLKDLWDSIILKDWRAKVVRFDVPSNGQILGDLLNEAKISGVLYKSKFTGKDCLAIFPETFNNSNNTVRLNDQVPHQETPIEINSFNAIVARMNFDEIIAIKKGGKVNDEKTPSL